MNIYYQLRSLLFVAVLFLSNNILAQNSEDNPNLLWGIYGVHDKHDCPVNDKNRAIQLVALSKKDLQPLFDKYGIVKFVNQFHSGLEHTFLWAVVTTRPHDLEEFSIELGLASWNKLTFVPLKTFQEGVLPAIKAIHKIE